MTDNEDIIAIDPHQLRSAAGGGPWQQFEAMLSNDERSLGTSWSRVVRSDFSNGHFDPTRFASDYQGFMTNMMSALERSVGDPLIDAFSFNPFSFFSSARGRQG